MKKYILVLLLLFVTTSTIASAYEMGQLGKAREASGVIEVRVIASKDSSTWIKYPNGFNRKEITRIITKCVVLRSSNQNIKDTINLYFELSDYAIYDSSGNLECYAIPFIMHSGEEFKMKKDSIYSCLVRNSGNRISLLRAETKPYDESYKELFGAKKINRFIDKYDKQNARELDMWNLFYHVSSSAIDTVLFYHRIKKKFIQLTNSTYHESKEYDLDVQNSTFYDKKDFYEINHEQKHIRIIKTDLLDLDECINDIEKYLYSEEINMPSSIGEISKDSLCTFFINKVLYDYLLQQPKSTKDFFILDKSSLNNIKTEYPNCKIHRVNENKLRSLIKKGQKLNILSIYIEFKKSNKAKIHITNMEVSIRRSLRIRMHNYIPIISYKLLVFKFSNLPRSQQYTEFIYNKNSNTVRSYNEDMLHRIGWLKAMYGIKSDYDFYY